MTITFAGVAMLLEDPEGNAAKHVQRYLEWPHSQINSPPRTIDPKSRVQRPQWPEMPCLKPNQLYIPTGATRWGKFIGLADTAGKDAIIAVVGRGGVGSLRMSLDDGVTVPVFPSSNKVDGTTFDLQKRIDTQMILLPPVPVSEMDDTLWIIPLVDPRFQWQTQAFISEATTWAGLLEEIVTSLGLPGIMRDDWELVDGVYVQHEVNTEYGIPDGCIFRNGMINTAAALDLYCWATNQRLCPVNRQWNPSTEYAVDDTVVNDGVFYTCTTAGTSAATGPGPSGLGAVSDSSVNWVGSTSGAPTYVLRSNTTSTDLYSKQVAAQLASFNGGQSSAGGELDQTKSADVPALIKFHFTNDGTVDHLAVSGGSPPSRAIGGTLDIICPATSTGANGADLTAMADRWANYFWQWSEHRFSWSMNRMLSWSLTGYEDYLLVDQSRVEIPGGVDEWGDEVPCEYQCRTLIMSLPPTGWGMDIVPTQVEGGGNTCGGGGTSGEGNCGCPHSNGTCDCPNDCFDVRMPAIECPAITYGVAGVHHMKLPKTVVRLDSVADADGAIGCSEGPCIQCGGYSRGDGEGQETMYVALHQQLTHKFLCLAWQETLDVDAPVYSAKYSMCQRGCEGPFYFDFVSAWKSTPASELSASTACDPDAGASGAPDTTFCWPSELIVYGVDCDCTDYYGGGGGGGGGGCDAVSCTFMWNGTSWDDVDFGCIEAGCGACFSPEFAGTIVGQTVAIPCAT